MTGFPLAQIADVLPFPCVLLEPCCVLPHAMLYLGCLSEPGVPVCSVLEGRWWQGGEGVTPSVDSHPQAP